MSLLRKERESRIELIRSIAQSQGAIARILNSIADITETSPGMSTCMRDNLRTLTALQLTMAEMTTGARFRRVRTRTGSSANPWLHQAAFISKHSASSRRPKITGGESH